MDVTKENFIAYERVRLRWQIDMNNTKEVARGIGAPNTIAELPLTAVPIPKSRLEF